MCLVIRKIIVIGIIGAIFLAGNILFVASWLAEKGVPEKANWLLENFLTGTAITIMTDYSYCISLLKCSESSLKHVLNLKGFPFS